MTLHDATEISKRVGIVLSIGFGTILLIMIFFRLSVVIKSILFPPKISPSNEVYGKLPPLTFPQSTIQDNFSYTINTVDNSLPKDFPDRLIVYPMIISQPNLLNLQDTKDKVASLGFVDSLGNTLPEIARGGPNYEWDDTSDLQRKIIYNIITQNFTMTSNYLASLTVLNAQNLGDENTAISAVQNFLSGINSFPTDIDISLTQSPNPDNTYTTSPLLYSITSGQLTPTSSLSNAQVIRVDLYQKEINYTITAGVDQNETHYQDFQMDLPILYPHPPYSTMNFLVASGQSEPNVVSAIFNHQTINLMPDKKATYPIKTADEAFTDLKNKKGYIASYNGTDSHILIDKVFLAYYLGEAQQEYLQPIIVFQGENGFFAYVPAIKSSSL